MKKIIIFLTLIVFAFLTKAQKVDTYSGATTLKQVTCGSNHSDEVYWDMENNVNYPIPRNEWDIAFTTQKMSANILANTGNKVNLYTYPKGTIKDWASVDTTGMDWIEMYNSVESWNGGAFMQNAVSSNKFDFGWGQYDMSTHNINGDSIFIIKLGDNDYRKLAIIDKVSTKNKWHFKFANLDGTNEITKELDVNSYSGQNFAYYSLKNDSITKHEPNKWHLLFTKYYDYNIPYYVAGVLVNQGITVQEVKKAGLNQITFTQYDTTKFSRNINTIGSDWKKFDLGTMSYKIKGDVVYFVKLLDGSIWKLYFTEFESKPITKYSFEQKLMNTSAIKENKKSFSSVYPNPAQAEINIIHEISGDCQISIYNTNGQVVYEQKATNNQPLNKQLINVENLPNGIYNVLIKGENGFSTSRFVKK